MTACTRPFNALGWAALSLPVGSLPRQNGKGVLDAKTIEFIALQFAPAVEGAKPTIWLDNGRLTSGAGSAEALVLYSFEDGKDAGAWKVIAEGREGGGAGAARPMHEPPRGRATPQKARRVRGVGGAAPGSGGAATPADVRKRQRAAGAPGRAREGVAPLRRAAERTGWMPALAAAGLGDGRAAGRLGGGAVARADPALYPAGLYGEGEKIERLGLSPLACLWRLAGGRSRAQMRPARLRRARRPAGAQIAEQPGPLVFLRSPRRRVQQELELLRRPKP